MCKRQINLLFFPISAETEESSVFTKHSYTLSNVLVGNIQGTSLSKFIRLSKIKKRNPKRKGYKRMNERKGRRKKKGAQKSMDRNDICCNVFPQALQIALGRHKET